MFHKKPSILACVTSQIECDRIIEEAKEIADAQDCELRVLSVLNPSVNLAEISGVIEHLYTTAKNAGADMTILFNNDAAGAVAQFVKANNAEHIVTGMHDGGDRSFLVRFNELAPDVSITMVTEDNLVYTMELCNAH